MTEILARSSVAGQEVLKPWKDAKNRLKHKSAVGKIESCATERIWAEPIWADVTAKETEFDGGPDRDDRHHSQQDKPARAASVVCAFDVRCDGWPDEQKNNDSRDHTLRFQPGVQNCREEDDASHW